MGRWRDRLRRLFGRGPALPDEAAEELRLAFKARHVSFKLLLQANSRALEIMTEIDEALRGAFLYGMTFVRSRCTRVTALVRRMVGHLDELAPERYSGLDGRLRGIREEIRAAIAPVPLQASDDLVVPIDDVSAASAAAVGNKMANLGEIRQRLDVRVPDGFVVTTRGYLTFIEGLQDEIQRRLQAADTESFRAAFDLSKGIQQLIVEAEVPAEIEEAILAQYGRLAEAAGGEVTLAVRSSALAEDRAGASFAGQYGSELNVSKESLLTAYKSVVASKYSLTAMRCRLQRGVRDEDVALCVGFLVMVDAEVGGVLYTRDPVDRTDDALVVSSTWGLPKAVVDGRMPTDGFVVERGDPPRIRSREVRTKEKEFAPIRGEGVGRFEVDADRRERPSLTDEQVTELARLGLRLESHYGTPQDVEWAIDAEGVATILQSRPLAAVVTPVESAEAEAPAPAPSSAAAAEDVATVLEGGITASPGAAFGPAFPVVRDVDALRFPEGGVLVVAQALPRWAVLLGRAAAVVSERGAVASHLASVAREFDVPALFGVEGALDALAEGRQVTVDADRQAVLEGRVASRLRRPRDPVGLMAGSPVYEALETASVHITPLNLLDPDDASFDPEHCKTLHDVTRFCHEKAVHEMFRFGKEHKFPERSAKQLYVGVPMQWWVLNLDDGFKEEVRGKYVGIQMIDSIPMLALWEGITAVPWGGPPPLDKKGFLAVMFEATTDASLDVTMPSKYVDKNYFMISRNYCSLQTRLGAHFAIVEAMVGERRRENYVSFQFKGGAADYERRLRRVLFIQELLEDHGFHVRVNDDNVIARVEGMDAKAMVRRLKILGYLTIHTRQLDMIMTRDGIVEHYRKKITEDIEKMLAGQTVSDTDRPISKENDA